MKYVFWVWGLMYGLGWPLPTYGQGIASFEGTDSLYRKVEGFGVGLPQEKAYLHLDNTCYFLGDTIWYKGYVTRSDRGTLTDLSKILYVELLTPDGYSVERQQLEMEDGTAHGMFVLKDTLYAGYYELRAYTRWMLNFGQCEYPHVRISEDLFYSKKMAKEFFRDYEKLYSRVFPVYDKPKKAGDFAKDMTLRPMRRYYKTPKKKKPKVDLRFYPEGGNLVAGAACRVALELNGEDGQHLGGMKLTVRDKEGKVAVVCRTDERGRTTFRLPDVSEQADFRATFTYKGYEYEEELPEVEKEGCALTVTVGDSVVEAVIQAVGLKRPVALHVMSGGVSRFYRPLPVSLFSNGMADTADEPASGLRVCRMAIPLDSLPTGVNQLTVFDGEGRIYADRLFFVNHHDYDAPKLAVSGVRQSYEPFDSITLHLQLTDPADSLSSLSLAVRDRDTEEDTYDNGTILTEMLLASEIKGFVENPGYYFESDDSLRRQALDRLMMVQGWRRYKWREMADVEPLALPWLPEKFQTIGGCVNRSERQNIDFKKISNLKKEVNVWAMFTQGPETFELKQQTKDGAFYMAMPEIYGDCMMFLSAAKLSKGAEYVSKRRRKGFTDEEAWPDYYVKLDLFHPHFAHPYSFYQDVSPRDLEPFAHEDSLVRGSFEGRVLPSVTVRTRRNGLRRYDPTKPAVVIDAYDAYNMMADYGLADVPFYYLSSPAVSTLISFLFVGDMNKYRDYFLRTTFNAWPNRLWDKPVMPSTPTYPVPDWLSRGEFEKYRSLSLLDKFYIYTDYVPREMGSWKYRQDNQPEVIVGMQLRPDGEYFPSCRDRRYLLHGYAVCDDFYSPDYSHRPLPETKDYRRTLLWMPEVEFDAEGSATVRLYNNSKRTAVSVEAMGVTDSGRYMQYNSVR
ncbi:hypothetical protein [Paraprevotella clara]|uniref:Macroglobulin domain-containing protein n=1 Tax=Paraprevotella clara YIT 11840 TaxID=762968 RepID=G5SQM9_9BACT|nr:hypothetical protein [Paraprevotella clara]EHH00432.1 hypothetical protein HMPREF9441_01669 [Paraprevotella clara YIT 11840]